MTATLANSGSPATRRIFRTAVALLAASAVVNGVTAAALSGGTVDFIVPPIGGLLAVVGGILLVIIRHAVNHSRWWLLRVLIIASIALVGLTLRNMATSSRNHASRYSEGSSRAESVHEQP